jgi:acetyltransferase
MKNCFLKPASVAVVGASTNPEKMGNFVLANIINGGFTGEITPINPKAETVLGRTAYPSVSDMDHVPELVVVTTPAGTIPDIVSECASYGVPAMIIISAGFRETGPNGVLLEKEILRRKGKMRIAGPNCLGFMSPVNKLNATFANGIAEPGVVGVISQSGAIQAALLDWAQRNRIGFSQYISLGIMLDYSWHDALYALGSDPHTKCILMYMESVGEYPREFVSAAREISAVKPIIVMKAGRTQAAAIAAASHTGAITGSDAVLDAVFERAGIVRVNDIDELFGMADLARMQPPKGTGLTIVTNAGGPGVMAVDALMETIGTLTPLNDEIIQKLDTVLPFTWSHNNPIDIIGDATPNRYREALEIVLAQPETNAILVILSPQVMTNPTAVAQAVIDVSRTTRVPIFTSWVGGGAVEEARQLFIEAGIPSFQYPDRACRMFGYVIERARRQHMLYITPGDASEAYTITPMNREIGRRLARYQRDGKTLLTEREAKDVLAAYNIPVPETYTARTAEEAEACAQDIGYPVVVKLLSDTITHKSDVGGVLLDIGNQEELYGAYESIRNRVQHGFEGVTVQPYINNGGIEIFIGASTDPQFGPVITFGTGGKNVEVYKDIAMGLPPLNRVLARRMMERTKMCTLLKGYRGAPAVNIEALENILVQFSRLVSEHGEIREIDINPLIASAKGIVAVDARIILHTIDTAPITPVIYPYPIDWVHLAHTKQGEQVLVRPIRPDDEQRIMTFHERLSEESVRTRYQQMVPLKERQRHERLGPRCNVDYDRHIAFVAEFEKEIIGVARIIKVGAGATAEFSLVVLDHYQDKGVGAILTDDAMKWTKEVGKVSRIEAFTTSENGPMIHLLRRFGFRIQKDLDSSVDAYLIVH